jgi:hypothetical protein
MGFTSGRKRAKTSCFGAYASPDLIVNLSFTPSHSKPGTSVAPPLTPRGPAQNQKISGSTYVGDDELGLSIKIKTKLVRAGVGRHRPGEQAPSVVPVASTAAGFNIKTGGSGASGDMSGGGKGADGKGSGQESSSGHSERESVAHGKD